MRHLRTMAAAFAVTSLAISVTNAQDQKNRERPRIDAALFDRLDANKDGIVTMDEIPADRKELTQRILERLDSDKDGKLTREEFEAGVNRARAKRPMADSVRKGNTVPGKRTEAQRPGNAPVAAVETPRAASNTATAGQTDAPNMADLFRALDSDNDGKLSRQELSKVAELILKFDTNGDGAITPEELAEGLRNSAAAVATPRKDTASGDRAGRTLEAIIKRADRNGDGKLSKDEAPEMMRDRFDELDKNKDGFLDRDELAAMGERARRLRELMGPGPGPGPGIGGFQRPGGPRPGGGGVNDANRERVAGMLRELDKDADGRLSAKEFGEARGEEFKKLDSNGDGYLTPDELARGLTDQVERAKDN